MIRRLPVALAYVLALLLASTPASAQECLFARVCTVPFHFDYFLPVTPENIAEQGSCARIPLANNNLWQTAWLLRYVGDGAFEYHFTRAMIAMPDGKAIYIDRFGGFRSKKGDSALSNRDLSRVQSHLDDMLVYHQKQKDWLHWYEWAAQAAHDHVARTEGWSENEYGIGIGAARLSPDESPEEDGLVIVSIWHCDDFSDLLSLEKGSKRGGGKSFTLLFDPETKALVRQILSR